MADLDVYQAWLDIPPSEQPPNHYRLIGLRSIVDDQAAISAAADRTQQQLQQYLQGEHTAACQALIAQVHTARTCLLDPAAKAQYDARLRGGGSNAEQPIASAPQIPGAGPESAERQIAGAPPVHVRTSVLCHDFPPSPSSSR